MRGRHGSHWNCRHAHWRCGQFTAASVHDGRDQMRCHHVLKISMQEQEEKASCVRRHNTAQPVRLWRPQDLR